LENLGGSTVHQVLGLLEAEVGERANFLDHLDLLSARIGDDDVEGVLLLGGGSTVAAGTTGGRSGGNGDRSGRGHLELLLEGIEELLELEDGHLLEYGEQLLRGHLGLGHFIPPRPLRPWARRALRRWRASPRSPRPRPAPLRRSRPEPVPLRQTHPRRTRPTPSCPAVDRTSRQRCA